MTIFVFALPAARFTPEWKEHCEKHQAKVAALKDKYLAKVKGVRTVARFICRLIITATVAWTSIYHFG